MNMHPTWKEVKEVFFIEAHIHRRDTLPRPRSGRPSWRDHRPICETTRMSCRFLSRCLIRFESSEFNDGGRLLRSTPISDNPSMASLPSLSSSSLTRPPRLFPPSSFKGNTRSLGAGQTEFRFPSLKSKVQGRERSLSVVIRAASASSSAAAAVSGSPSVRFRLDNLGPQPGSRKKAKRKGRGISAGQGASCGFGMRGQKSRSGPGVMKGFEGGQMPLYRRIPKLRGIAGDAFRVFDGLVVGDGMPLVSCPV
ncbi:hypothetical protein CRG98_019108 [Punica granatum]|uniref:Uncharacterized protein n=1 Tax=Punica granatum TaxID=22663 RepID=A0A2I0JVW1_PUNGR|nr:hypothetical protein CRG98_019108 [Punica granatum]